MRSTFRKATSRCYVRFVTQDRIDLGIFAGLIEFQRPVQIAMVGEGQGIHAQVFGFANQFFDRARAI